MQIACVPEDIRNVLFKICVALKIHHLEMVTISVRTSSINFNENDLFPIDIHYFRWQLYVIRTVSNQTKVLFNDNHQI